jgi:hypothetical protein
MHDLLPAMHRAFEAASGLQRNYLVHERTWYDLARMGYTLKDVENFLCWIAHVNSQREPKYRRQYSIHRMFGDLSRFDEDLIEAKAWAQNRRKEHTPKEQALQDLRPVVDPELEEVKKRPARSAGEILRQILSTK